MHSKNRIRSASLACALVLFEAARLWAQPAPAGEIYQALRRLNELGSVLLIAAHPDDERSELLAYFARGRHMRAAYLSLTRGEGGQNLLGPEQGAALGVLRTQELLAARRIDGGEQFFTRAIDFGFSKSADESIQKWGREQVLSDIVWVIRRYRPDIVMLGSSAAALGGHGHHQASAILGRDACDAAGDPARFPDQLQYVQPWKPAKVVTAGFGAANSVQIDTSGYNPIIGYSYQQLATMSRGQHRSQGLGGMAIGGGMGGGRGGRGGRATAGGTPAGPDVFDGIDHSWKRVADGTAVDAILAQAIREFDWEHPQNTIPLLAKARPLIAAMSDPLAKLKLADLDETVARSAGIWADAQAAQGDVTPGSHVSVNVTVSPRLPVAVTVTAVQPAGVWSGPVWSNPDSGAAVPSYELEVPSAQPYSQPYWLVKSPQSSTYVVDDQTLIGLADTPIEQMRIHLTVAGCPIELVRPILYRYNDRLEGEKVRPLAVVPPVAVNLSLSPDLTTTAAVFASAAARRLPVRVKASAAGVEGTLRVAAPAGWRVAPPSQPFRLGDAGDQQELSVEVTPPVGEAAGTLHVSASVNGQEIAAGMSTIAYSHIPQQLVFPPADVKLVRSDIRVTARRVGYIMGAGDDMPEALRQLGLEVTLLQEDDLRNGELSRFDAIVAGVRSYNVRSDVRKYHARLMEYVSGGGTYVVQYLSAGAQSFGPYPITIPGGNSYRVTVEDAPVAFPHPDSPLLLKPNRIATRDFDGWVQERGLLFSTQWDAHYETVLSSADPGENPLEGGELWMRYGKGVYVFTSYAWFRQLPAGVPGAFRLFANLISAKE